MLNGKNMDGLDLSGIMGKLQPVLPILSYILNLLTKAFEIFTSYIGFDITLPSPEEDASDNGNVEDAIV